MGYNPFSWFREEPKDPAPSQDTPKESSTFTDEELTESFNHEPTSEIYIKHFLYGISYMKEKEYGKALRSFQYSLELNCHPKLRGYIHIPSGYAARFHLAETMMMLDFSVKSIESQYLKVVESDDSEFSARALFGLGDLHVRNKKI